MITSQAVPYRLKGTKVFRVVKSKSYLSLSDNYIAIEESNKLSLASNILSSNSKLNWYQKGVYGLNKDFISKINENDIVMLTERGIASVVWKNKSDDNLLFVTDYCNSNCIMCPQTKVEKQEHYYKVAENIVKLVKEQPRYLCITGGEPTFLKEEYLALMSSINRRFPYIALQILTNGKNFSDFNFAKKAVLSSPIDSLYAIPLYSAAPWLHDDIVGVKDSFAKTINGIQNLYRLKQNIEIRIVITKKNYRDLPNIAHFIYWNIPFVFRVVFMGMETHGVAEENFSEVWVEPSEYIEYLQNAILFLDDRLINSSIYNIPHCLLSEEIECFAKDSISAWKKNYLPLCEGCRKKDICSGFFSTSVNIPKGIHNI